MIVLGADMHKASHTLAAVVAGTGEVRGDKTIAVGSGGFCGGAGVGPRTRARARLGP